MAGVMTYYNSALKTGITIESLQSAWQIFPLIASIAFVVEWFFVGKTAHYLIRRYIKESDSIAKKVLLSAFFFVAQMATSMATICSLLFQPFDEHFLPTLLMAIPKNFVVAYPLKVIIAGPLVGLVFRKVFPIGIIVYDK